MKDVSEKVILTNMCMIYDDIGNVVIQERKESGWPGIVFPGGHIEVGESIIESVRREIYEETGLKIGTLQQCGIKQFFTKNDERYMVFLYKTNIFEGKLTSSAEGEVKWVKMSCLSTMKLASGFEDMLPLFMQEKGELIYRNGGKDWIDL